MSTVLKKQLGKVKKMIHPNSRKSLAIVKKTNKIHNRTLAKQTGSIKQMLVREKMIWIQENMLPDVCPYTPELTADLLEKYIARHDEELALIAEKNNVARKKNISHASRADVLRMTKDREREEYDNSGIEIPNILTPAQCTLLRKWDGDVRYLPNFVFRRFGKKHLQEALQRNAKVPKKLAKTDKTTPVVPDKNEAASMDTD